jgi:hypothetical protein
LTFAVHPSHNQQRQTTRAAGVATTLTILTLVITLVFLYIYPFFTHFKTVSLTSTSSVAVSTGLLAAALSMLVLPRLTRLPPAVAVILISMAVGFVPAVACGGWILFQNGVPQGFAVLLTILLGALIGGLLALIKPIQIPLAAVTAGTISLLAFRFVGAALSGVLLPWLIYELGWKTAELIPLAIGLNVVLELVVVSICTAAIVPGVAKSPAVAGRSIAAGTWVGLLPGALRLIVGAIAALPLLAFPTESDDSPINFPLDVLPGLGYSVLAAILGALVGALAAAVASRG